jgi:uncharacterized protein YukE
MVLAGEDTQEAQQLP